jgi:hypothetical protein
VATMQKRLVAVGVVTGAVRAYADVVHWRGAWREDRRSTLYEISDNLRQWVREPRFRGVRTDPVSRPGRACLPPHQVKLTAVA